jgi:hypothetical protein
MRHCMQYRKIPKYNPQPLIGEQRPPFYAFVR